jgi:hypothetical protein
VRIHFCTRDESRSDSAVHRLSAVRQAASVAISLRTSESLSAVNCIIL